MRGIWGIIDRYIHEVIIMGKSGTDGARSPQLLRALLSDTIMATVYTSKDAYTTISQSKKINLEG